MGSKSGQYSGFKYDEKKRHLILLSQRDHPLPDGDLNDGMESIVRQIQRLAQRVLGDVSSEDAWKIATSGTNNNFEITGGDGTVEGAGRAWVGGFPCLITDTEKNFIDNAITEPNIHAKSTGVASNVLTDSAARYPVDALIGRELIPDITDDTGGPGVPKSFTIIDNDETTITTDPGDGSLTDVAAIGNRYRISLSTFTGAYNFSANPTSPAIIGDDEIFDTANFNTGAFIGGLFKVDGNTYQVIAHDTGTSKITIAPKLLTNVDLIDTYNLIDTRLDTVYLDTYLDEVSAEEDPDLFNDLSGTQVEGARRSQLVQTVFVDENDSGARRVPQKYIDVDGNSHNVAILANFRREDAQTNIPTANIDTLDGVGFGADGGGGGFGQSGNGGSGGTGAGMTRNVDMSSFVNEVIAARLGASSLVNRLTADLFVSLADVAVDPTLTLGDIKLNISGLTITGPLDDTQPPTTIAGDATVKVFLDQLAAIFKRLINPAGNYDAAPADNITGLDARITINTNDIETNDTATGLNTTHRGSNGTDHIDVVSNTTHRGSDGSDHSSVVLNTTHRGSDGSDHSLSPTSDQKAAMTAAASPDTDNPFATIDELALNRPRTVQYNGISGAGGLNHGQDLPMPSGLATGVLTGGNLLIGAMTIPLVSTAGFVAPGIITIEDEHITYTAIEINNLIVGVRGARGSTAAEHIDAAKVYTGQVIRSVSVGDMSDPTGGPATFIKYELYIEADGTIFAVYHANGDIGGDMASGLAQTETGNAILYSVTVWDGLS